MWQRSPAGAKSSVTVPLNSCASARSSICTPKPRRVGGERAEQRTHVDVGREGAGASELIAGATDVGCAGQEHEDVAELVRVHRLAHDRRHGVGRPRPRVWARCIPAIRRR